LYAKAVMTGFKRGLRNQHENTSILKIQNVREAEAAKFYCGKRVCFIYKSLSVFLSFSLLSLTLTSLHKLRTLTKYFPHFRAKVEKKGSRFRTIWGKVTRVHGKGYFLFVLFCHVNTLIFGLYCAVGHRGSAFLISMSSLLLFAGAKRSSH
jgi:large subunit ribosomal protein L35Ae